MANADRLIELFNEAKARPAGPERERLLTEACPGDPELKAQVLSLLQAHEGAGEFLKNTILSPTALITEKPGDNIGRYKLLQVIGEGGCGVVYMAEQSEPVRRKVALKVIKLGMDTKQVVARFEAERQALALMDHPNIAKVFDAGATDTGRPYFVMELVRGIKITDYCDQNQLSTRARLDLFIQVCQAIQHAHQKGIIHRDIKPSNVLVSQHDTMAVPKVIDFGIAKATSDQRLTDKTLFTAFEQFMGTPAYMSSEQAQWSGLDIDTRTDIYSLGVLLYELLTGQTPFDAEHLLRSGLDEMRRIIREEEPLRPSTRLGTLGLAEATELSRKRQMKIPELAHGVRGDLDWIVMKCLEKDRTRRYETANGLALDLRRHLDNEPVMARPPSTAYRIQKAFRRNKLAFTAAAAVAVVLVVGVAVSTWQAIEASRARNAETRQRLAAQTARDKAQGAQEEAEQQTQRTQAALTRVELERAESMFAADSPARAITYLARLLRQAPTNQVVAQRLLSALSSRNFCLPTAPPLKHNGQVNCAQFSPDGRLVVTASQDATAEIWESRTGQSIGETLRHGAEIKWAQFSPDSRCVVTASGDGTAQVWDVLTGQRVGLPLQHESMVLCAAFSPNSRRVVTGSRDKTIRLWDAVTGDAISAPITNKAAVYFVCFSPDGNEILAAVDNKTARLLSCTDGSELVSFTHGREIHGAMPFPRFSPNGRYVVTLREDEAQIRDSRKQGPVVQLPHRDSVTSVAFSSDGELVATGSIDHTARVWTRTGQPVTPALKHDGYVYAVQFNPEGTLLLTSAADKSVRMWHVPTGKPATEPLQHGSRVNSMQFSQDGRQILALPSGNEAVIWQVHFQSAMPLVLQHKAAVRAAVFSPDGRRVATVSGDWSAQVWDAHTGVPITPPLQNRGAANCVQFSPDGNRVVTALDREVGIWDATSGRSLVKPAPQCLKGVVVKDIHFSPDGKSVVMAGAGGGCWVWDAATGEPISHPEPTGDVQCAVFSPDGQRVATASYDFTGRVWDARTGKPITDPLRHDDRVDWIEFSPDGNRVVTASRDKTARIWDASTGRMITQPLIHADVLSEFYSVQFSPDGRRVVTAAGNAVQIWNAYTGEPVSPPMEHRGLVTSVRFTPDGSQLATASLADGARIWDAASGHPVSEPLRHAKGCHYAEFSRDGRFVVTASADETAAIWWMPLPPLPSPAWLPDLAEALAGRRMDDGGNRAVVPVENLFRLKERLLEAAGGGDSDFYAVWTRRFFAESAESAASVLLRQATVNKLERSTNALEFANAARSLARATNGSLERLKTADSLSSKAAVLAPNDPGVLEIRAQVLERMGDWAGAISVLDEGIGRLPTNPSLWKTKGTLLQQANRTNEALEAISKAIELASAASDAPKTALNELLLNRCSLLISMNRFGEAVMDYRRAKEFFPPPSPKGTNHLARLPDFRLASRVSMTLGATNDESGLQQAKLADDRMPAAKVDGQPCRTLENARDIAYVTFLIDPTFKWSCGGKAVIEVEYFDAGSGKFGIDYDGFKGAYMQAKSVALRETRQWSLAKFEVNEARFENLQDNKADFRLWIRSPRLSVRRISVSKVTSNGDEAVSPPMGFLRPFPVRDSKARPNLINLEQQYNAVLTENWHHDSPENSLASLPTGVHTLGGIDFDLRGLIQVMTNSQTYPEQVTGIEVGQPCKRVHFLHAGLRVGQLTNGTLIGRYVIHTSDGRQEMPIRVGRDLADWWKPRNETNNGFAVVWSGTNEKSRKTGSKIRLFKSTWENPHPEVPVRSIDFHATHPQASPFLIAITAE